jgi:NAD(P)-dependent dehydrogenase (short-subunit alcohol dehydrogenase family)
VTVDFAGQVVLVTGAGRGLGRLYALELARRGASVVVNDLGSTTVGTGDDAAVADAVVAEIEAAGGSAVASYASVATAEGAAAIVASGLDAFGRLDAVVSNAGIFHTAPFEELDVGAWDRMLRVHLDGSFHVAQAAFPVMRAQGGGRFVFIASSAGLFGQPNSAHYSAAKTGIYGLANVVAIEGAEHGILANTVLPFGETRMATETIGDDLEAARGLLDAINPDLVVPMVVFLASRSCTETHQAFSAGAGRYARVFVGLGSGWTAEAGVVPTAEDIVDNLAMITSPDPYTIPSSIFDEVATLMAMRSVTR